MKNLSIKTSISLLIIVTVSAFLITVLFSLQQLSKKVAQHLNEQQTTIQTLQTEIEKNLAQQLEQLSNQVNDSFSMFLNQMREVLSTVETNPDLQMLLQHETIPYGNYENTPYRILPPANKEAINQLLVPYFSRLVDGFSQVQYAYIGTPQGAMYIGPLGDYDFTQFDPRTRPWYKDALNQPEKYVWTDPYIDAITGEAIMTLAKTVKINDVFVGVAALDFSIQSITSMVNTTKIGEQGYAFLLDQNGILLAHPQLEEKIGTSIVETYPYLAEIYEDDSGTISFIQDGNRMIASYVTNPLTGWKLVVTVLEEELFRSQQITSQFHTLNQSIFTDLKQQQNNITFLFLGIGGLLAGAGIFIAHFYSKSMSSQIQTINVAMQQLSQGDLTHRVPVNTKHTEINQLNEHFNQMAQNLQQLVQSNIERAAQIGEAAQTFQEVSTQTASGAEHMERIIKQMLNLMSTQASNIQQTGKVIASFHDEMQKVNSSMKRVEEAVEHSQQASAQGASYIHELENTSKRNLTLSKTAAKNIQSLYEQMDQVHTFSKTIRNIAENTQMLALNASIEAARADVNSQGFAVVAEQVRKLADEATKATIQITDILDAMQKQMNESIMNIEETEHAASKQHEILTLSKMEFERIHAAIEEIHQQMNQTNDVVVQFQFKNEKLVQVSDESRSASDQAVNYITNIQHTIEQQLQAWGEIATYTEHLTHLYHALESEISRFKTNH